MANPFDQFGGFLFAVYAHLFTLLAGCVVTVLLNYIEKHTPLKGKITWKVDLGIVLLFLFFACFQAWHDEYKKANDLQTKLDQKPTTQPSIQINVPPAQVVIEQLAGTANPNGPLSFLQVMSIETATEDRAIRAGNQVALNVGFQEVGDSPIQNIQNFETLTVGTEENEEDLKTTFHKLLTAAIRRSKGLGGMSLIVDGRFYNSAVSPILTDQQARGILDGSQRLYLHVWATWKSGDGKDRKTRTMFMAS